MRLFKETNIQFIKNRKIAYVISSILILAGLISLVINGGPKWSIDFTGGVSIEMDLKAVKPGVAPLHIDQLRDLLKSEKVKDAEIQKIGDENGTVFLIRAREMGAKGNTIVDIIKRSLPDYTTGKTESELVRLQEVVGPKVGGELRWQALKAVFISLILMIIYIWIRFEFTFGVAAILALFHDVFITVGLFSITGREISITVVAALLTLVGFSINDTIVVFDRIREDMKIYRKDPIISIFDKAINETLSRTVITSGTVFFTVLSLFIFGGSVINDFAFAMLVGTIVGTYSSVCVASPLVAEYLLRHQDKKAIAQKVSKKK